MNSIKKSIAIFTPYFGHINDFFKLWLRSACFNETIDFFIPTDCSDEIVKTGFVKKNIHIIPMFLDEFKEKTNKAIGFVCNIDHARKVCDYRCAIGLIFKEELTNYDFWGYTDNDQILGDIRHFITDEILSKYDKIGRWGHFSIFRNVDYMNTLFMTDLREEGCLYYKDVYNTPYNCFFEEATMINFCKKNGIDFFENESCFMDISPSSFKFIDRKWDDAKKPYYVIQDGIHVYAVECKRGKTSKQKKEIMYAHFQKRKLTIQFENLTDEKTLVFYPNAIIDGNAFDENFVIKQSIVSKPFYGLKKRVLHSYAVRYNNYHKKHSKTFKQKYY